MLLLSYWKQKQSLSIICDSRNFRVHFDDLLYVFLLLLLNTFIYMLHKKLNIDYDLF